MTPREANTENKILTLTEDNFPPDPNVWSILVSEGSVSIHQPNGGGFACIPREQFDALIDWYQRDQKQEAEKAS